MNGRWKKVIVGALVAGGILGSGAAWAEEGSSLQDRLDKLEQRYNVLERKYENDQDAAADKARTGQSVTANPGDGFTIKNADKSFVLKLSGYVQTDLRTYLDDKAGALANQFLIRRARIWAEGTLYNTVDFRIVPDFGGTAPALQDAYLNLRYWNQFQLRVGKFKPGFGLERLQPTNQTLFVETSYATALTPNYDIGAQAGGDLWNGAANYAVGYFNGVPDNQNASTATGDNADGKDVVARLFLLPFKNGGSLTWKDLGFGFAASHGRALNDGTNPALPSYTTPGQQSFFTFTPSAGADVSRPPGLGRPGVLFLDGRDGDLRQGPQAPEELRPGEPHLGRLGAGGALHGVPGGPGGLRSRRRGRERSLRQPDDPSPARAHLDGGLELVPERGGQDPERVRLHPVHGRGAERRRRPAGVPEVRRPRAADPVPGDVLGGLSALWAAPVPGLRLRGLGNSFGGSIALTI